ncbi:PEP-CTERM sorting domain-containing protein [Pirellulales bacterium]|nr:PEP-CTERM sorting domain-containing protein [Pirellulales bacterium]
MIRLRMVMLAVLVQVLPQIAECAEVTTFTVKLRANYDFNILGGTPINPDPETGFIPFQALGELTFELDPILNDPSEPTTVPFVSVTGMLQGTSPPPFLPHVISPNLRFVGGALTDIVRDAAGEVVSARVDNLEMQWEMIGQPPGPLDGLRLPTGGNDFDPNSSIPFDAVVGGLPFALGDVLKGPDVGIPMDENFQVFLGDAQTGPLVVLGRKRTLTVVPEPAALVMLLLGTLALSIRRTPH